MGPILFNICLRDLLFLIDDTDFASYADFNTIYSADGSSDDIIVTTRFCWESFSVVEPSERKH